MYGLFYISNLQDFENLRDNVDYSGRFVTDRKFNSLDELHSWADAIAITIDFQFTRASYKQKEGRSRVSVYLRCHCCGNIMGDLHNQIYNVGQSIRREEIEGRTPLQHCFYMATKLNYVV